MSSLPWSRGRWLSLCGVCAGSCRSDVILRWVPAPDPPRSWSPRHVGVTVGDSTVTLPPGLEDRLPPAAEALRSVPSVRWWVPCRHHAVVTAVAPWRVLRGAPSGLHVRPPSTSCWPFGVFGLSVETSGVVCRYPQNNLLAFWVTAP